MRPGRSFSEIKSFPKRLHEAYKIKIGKKGDKVTSGKGTKFRLPMKSDHFTITLANRNEAGDFVIAKEIMDKLLDLNGDRLGIPVAEINVMKKESNYKIVTEVPIRLLFDDITQNLSYKLAFYHGRNVICHGNGEEAEWLGQETNGRKPGDIWGCAWDDCPYYRDKKCKTQGRLMAVLECAPELGSVAVFRTTGFNSIQAMLSSLDTIYRASNGILAGVPLILTLSPKTTTIPGQDKSTTIYVVNIVYRPKKETMEIGEDMAQRSIEVSRVRQSNRIAWDKTQEAAKEVEVSILEEESEPENIQAHAEEFAPESVQEQIEQDAQDEDTQKAEILDQAKAKMRANKMKVMDVNKKLAEMRTKPLAEIQEWFMAEFLDDPQSEKNVTESTEAVNKNTETVKKDPEKVSHETSEPDPDPDPSAAGDVEIPGQTKLF